MNTGEERSLKGKTVAVTGATGGLGNELCRHLCKAEADLILLDRDPEKSKALEARLKAEFPLCRISRIQVDLSDIESVFRATEELVLASPDVLIHNAGAYNIPRKIATSGYDNVFTINFVSPYYMTRRLLEKRPETHVVAVGSIAHTYSRIDQNDVDFRTRRAASKVYGNAKRYLMLALHALARDGAFSLAVVHPGISATNITAHYPKLVYALIKHPMKWIFMKPKKASLSIFEGVFTKTPYGTWIGPRIFDVWGMPRRKKLPACREDEVEKARLAADRIYDTLAAIASAVPTVK